MPHFTNRGAILLWIVAPLVVLIMSLGTFQMATGKILSGQSPALIVAMLALLWLVALWLVRLAADAAITHVQVEHDRAVRVIRRYPHRTDRRTFRREQLRRAEVIEVRDSEGDVYFARVSAADGVTFDLVGTSTRRECEDACRRFNEAVFAKQP